MTRSIALKVSVSRSGLWTTTVRLAGLMARMVPRMAISSALLSSGSGSQRAPPAAAAAEVAMAKAMADRRKVVLNMIPHAVWADGM